MSGIPWDKKSINSYLSRSRLNNDCEFRVNFFHYGTSIYGPLLNGDDCFITDTCILLHHPDESVGYTSSHMPPSSRGLMHAVEPLLIFNLLILLSNSGHATK